MQILSFVVIKKKGRYLLIKEASLKYRGKWYFPGGKAEEGEKPERAAIRETREEAGCKVRLSGIFFLKYNDKMRTKKLHIYYSGKIKSGKIKTYADKNSLSAEWFTFKEIKKLPLRDNALDILALYKKQAQSIPVESFVMQK